MNTSSKLKLFPNIKQKERKRISMQYKASYSRKYDVSKVLNSLKDNSSRDSNKLNSKSVSGSNRSSFMLFWKEVVFNKEVLVLISIAILD